MPTKEKPSPKRTRAPWLPSLVLGLTILLFGTFLVLAGSELLTSFAGGLFVVIFTLLSLSSGLVELIVSRLKIKDPTDRFMWTVCGIAGVVCGIVILNAGNFADKTSFIRVFGTFLMIHGLTSLFFGVHNRPAASRAKKSASPKKPKKTIKKS